MNGRNVGWMWGDCASQLSSRLARALLALIATAMLTFVLAPASTAHADDASIAGAEKTVDPSTVNNWKDFFFDGEDTAIDTHYAGNVWTDKSVFKDAASYVAAVGEVTDGSGAASKLAQELAIDDGSFLVALSAMASAKSVEGYSTLPSDTILVLDLSASMVDSNNAVDEMVEAANNAIKTLLELNVNNRVGVIAYSGNSVTGSSAPSTAAVILPLGRYTAGVDGKYLVDEWTTRSGNRTQWHTGVKVANGVTGTVAAGVGGSVSSSNSKDADGGTYIQNGLLLAWEQFEGAESTTVESGLQAGVARIPVLTLLSDGAPTTATTNYTSRGTSDSGNGSADYATNGIAFMTQLTASWVRDKMEEKYGEEALFYTLGLSVGNNSAALNLLDPSSHTGTDGDWNSFKGLTSGEEMSVTIREGSSKTIKYTAPVFADRGWNEDYVTDYFPASNAAGLIGAFQSIVEQIVIQSLYYPTHVDVEIGVEEDGFLEFEDYIGKYMEVKAVKGIQLGSELYTGEELAKLIYEGGAGTVESPTEFGNELVWSVQARLGINNVNTARSLIDQAYAHGQLSYDPVTGDFSNYIGWYADSQDKFVGFWDGVDPSPEAVPSELEDKAAYAIKSYGYLGAAGEGHRATDMMYATIQVKTTIKAVGADASGVGDVRLIGKLPAALIPLQEYHVELSGSDPMSPTKIEVEGAEYPSRLIYEVGLSGEVDVFDLASTAEDAVISDGSCVFHTNQWQVRDLQGEPVEYHYNTNKNATSLFFPSVENERYYYNVDTPIYEKTGAGQYVLYVGEAAPAYAAGRYYHRSVDYTADSNGGGAQASYLYEPVSQFVLEHASDTLQKQADSTWIVKRGIIHHIGDHEAVKSSNNTDTVRYSEKPFVHGIVGADSSTPGEYHVDSYLGNNGKLTLDPPEGIKISKTAYGELATLGYTYQFTVTALASGSDGADTSFDKNYTLVIESASGERTWTPKAFANGVATVSLKHGETAYLFGEGMSGKTFKVVEAAGSGYEVASVNGDANVDSVSLSVSQGTISAAAFVNELASEPTYKHATVGLSGTKKVSDDIRKLQQGAYQFALYQVTQEAGSEELTLVQTVSNGVPTDSEGKQASFVFDELTFNAAGTYTYRVKEVIPSEAVNNVHHGITYDASVFDVTITVTEPDSKKTGESLVATIEIKKAGVQESNIVFTNFYKVSSIDIGFNATKSLEGDTLRAGEFTFSLYEASWASATQGIVKGDKLGDATNGANGNIPFGKQTYTKPGAYYYVIEEEIPAEANPLMAYDGSVYYVEVDVIDNLQGGLEATQLITKVDEDGVVTHPQEIVFSNVLSPEPAKVSISGKKTFENGTLTQGAFSFDLYQAMMVEGAIKAVGEPVLTADVEADGGFAFSDVSVEGHVTSYLTFDQPGTHHFVVKESVPSGVDASNPKANGVTFDLSTYAVTVEVTKDHDANGREILEAGMDVEGDSPIVFTNVYEPEDPDPIIPILPTDPTASVTISAAKTLDGAVCADGEFSFQLKDASGKVVDTAVNGAGGVIAFDALTFGEAGTYEYAISEVAGTDEGIAYDDSVYKVTVTVTESASGVLSAVASVTKDGVAHDGAISFANKTKEKGTEDDPDKDDDANDGSNPPSGGSTPGGPIGATGDGSPILPLAVVLTLAMLCVAVALVMRKHSA